MNYKRHQNVLNEVYTQFLQVQVSLAETEKTQHELRKPQVLKNKIAAATHKLKEIQRLTEHLTYSKSKILKKI